jgi:hypothetical protein
MSGEFVRAISALWCYNQHNQNFSLWFPWPWDVKFSVCNFLNMTFIMDIVTWNGHIG